MVALLGASLAVAQGRFIAAGELGAPRNGHTATLLDDGRVLVVGGRGADVAELSSTELWDPKSNRFTFGPPLRTGRSGHTATLLSDGRVLVAGGTTHLSDKGGERFVALESCELYDPKTNKWSPAAPMAQSRHWHTATRLADGRVVAVGGARENKQLLESVEAYTPASNSWASLAPLAATRSQHRAVLLADGTLLVVGGRTNQNNQPRPVATAERLTAEGQWSAAPTVEDARQNHAAVLLRDGRVLVIGGNGQSAATNLCELWKPGESKWQLAEHSLSMALSSHSATLLRSGDVLVVGGEPYNAVDSGWAQRFDVEKQAWCLAGQMKASRKGHTATALPNGRVLVVGGLSAGLVEATAELWESSKGPCQEPPGISLDPF